METLEMIGVGMGIVILACFAAVVFFLYSKWIDNDNDLTL